MPYNFDEILDRRHSDSFKWNLLAEDVIPMFIADMDFRSPEPVIQALRARVENGVFGYPVFDCPPLREIAAARMGDRYGWEVSPDWVTLVPGVVTGFNQACLLAGEPGAGVLVQPPVYPPMLSAAGMAGRRRVESPLVQDEGGRWGIDFDDFDRAAGEAVMFLLCSPHNPVGRVFTPGELERLAEICLRRGLLIVSDEIHADLLLDGARHTPFATLAPEVAARTITLVAPSKTFNLAGLQCSLAIIPDPDLRRRFAATLGLTHWVNLLGMTAALAAYREGQPWLDALLPYLEANIDFLMETVRQRLPGVRMTRPQATYLAWLDCRDAALPGGPQAFFLKEARVGLQDGHDFGAGGEGFVRLNFGCPRATLAEALDRMAAALARI